MIKLIETIGEIFGMIIGVLNTRFFSDIPLTYLDLILGAALLKVVFTFVFGGYKEVNTGIEKFSHFADNKVRQMDNSKRKQQLANKK